jgi:hypothetical protein
MGEVTAEYMDVFSNPVALPYLKSLDPGSKACRDDRYMACRDDRYMDSIYLALKRLSVIVKQPMDFQSIVVELSSFAFSAPLREYIFLAFSNSQSTSLLSVRIQARTI